MQLTRPILSTCLSLLAAAAAMAGPGMEGKKDVVPVEPAPEPDIWVHPITAPYWHEDSFITTDLRPVFAYHEFPSDVLDGHATVSALQLRVKLLKNLQLVAYKDGWVEFDTPGLKDRGWNDIAAGLKWAFIQDDAHQFHAALGLGYEFASGDDHVLQDDDEGRVWLSLNKGFGKLHLGVTGNYRKTFGNGDDILGNSDSISWHLHADYELCPWFSPVVEVNGYHVVNENADHSGVITPFSGADVANLGGDKTADVVTMGVGAEVRPCRQFAVRAAYEFPLSDNLDVFGQRWTFSAVIKF